jgi:hypothetical protein
MNQNILQYYILGGTIWRKRRRARAKAIADEEKRKREKAESINLVRSAVSGRAGTTPKKGILTESHAASSETCNRSND